LLKIKFIFFYLLICLFTQNVFADEKFLVIDKLKTINSLSFEFEQIANDKTETGKCILVFDNKLKCNYFDDKQKEILVNGKTLVVIQKKYNKIYYYPLSKSLFSNILNKENLINFIKQANLTLDDNINLFVLNESNKIVILFNKKNYNLLGWKVEDNSQNIINFSIKITNINKNYDYNIFTIPQIN
jgi:outer membrane lipoprotein-sorting protein